MYRLTKKAIAQRQKLEAMRIGRERARMARPVEERAPELPEFRRRIIIEDWDFGHRVHVLELHRTNRRDCYRVVADGKPWKDRIGWSAILAGLRKSMPRVGGALLLHPPLQKQQLPRRHRGIAAESGAGVRVGRRVGGTRSSVGGGAIRLAGGVGNGGQLDASKVGLPAQPARAVQAAKISRALRIGRLRVGSDGGLPAHRGARAGFGGIAQGGDAGGEPGMIGGAVLHALDPSGAVQRGGEQRQCEQAVGPGDQAGHTDSTSHA